MIASAENVVDSDGTFEFGGIGIRSFSVFHDETSGSERGNNLVSIVEFEGLRIAHLGDLGHIIDPEELPELEGVDVLLIPVGGFFTIDAGIAASIVKKFRPKIVIPMHFKTEKCPFPPHTVDDFISGREEAVRANDIQVEITADSLPAERQILVLDYAL